MRAQLPRIGICCFLTLLLTLAPAAAVRAQDQPAAAAPEQVASGAEETEHELFVTAGKSVVVTSVPVIQRVAMGFGDVAEAAAVGLHEVLVSGKTPGSTSLIVWQEGGGKLYFNVTVRPNTTQTSMKLEGLRRELRRELPDEKITVSIENDIIFLRGNVKNMTSAERAMTIAGSVGKTVNLLYVDVPRTEEQILLKVRFASVARKASDELGMNLVSTGATNTIGRVTTGQFSPPRVDTEGGQPTVSLTDALNVFLFRPDLNLLATLRALQTKGLAEILAEPNVLAINGKPASFLAGGEYPYPILQGGGGGLGTVTIQFREFGIRLNFLPTVTPRDTIRLQVVPEVSALDFANGLVFQGFTIPALTVRRVATSVELSAGQSFAIGGLLDRRLTETFQKIPLLSSLPGIGKIFQSKSLARENTELLVIVTPELVQPIDAGQPVPTVDYPMPLTGLGADTAKTNPVLPPVGARQPVSIPVEKYVEMLKQEQSQAATMPVAPGLAGSSWQPETSMQPLLPGAGQPAGAPSASGAKPTP